jgi:hypothetical protein
MRLQAVFLAFSIFAVGCNQSPSSITKEPLAKPTGVVQIERLPDAEAVLSEIGKTAWVFKHRGGELTAEFVISHRPAGSDQKETIVFQRSGDDAVNAFHAIAGKQQPTSEGGFLILALDKREITFSFGLAGAKNTKIITSDDNLPNVIFSGGDKLTDSKLLHTPLSLKPGEAQVLVEHAVHYHSSTPNLPAEQRELVRYSLRVIALKDGQLPKRDAVTAE